MLRLSGVTLSEMKRIEIALTYIYGIGIQRSKTMLDKANIPFDTKVKDITEEEEAKLRVLLQEYMLEGDLRRKVQLDIKRLQDIGCYRGVRHKKGLPCRGQQTRQMLVLVDLVRKDLSLVKNK